MNDLNASERRAEILRILICRRSETMRNLAFELGVTDRTIRSDITALTVDHPIETIRGNGGCVKLAEWYHPHRNILSQEHQTVLRQMLDKADEYQNRVLLEILTSFGSGKQLNIADGM